MDSIVIAPITVENVKEMVALQNKNSFSDGWTENMLLDGFIKGGLKGLGAYNGENLIGFLTYSFCQEHGEIQDLLVAIEYRKKGIGNLLIKNFFDIATSEKIKEIFLEVRENNFTAINLYTKNGFNQIGDRKKYYSNGENAKILQKTL